MKITKINEEKINQNMEIKKNKKQKQKVCKTKILFFIIVRK
jgi:hypothetical protein